MTEDNKMPRKKSKSDEWDRSEKIYESTLELIDIVFDPEAKKQLSRKDIDETISMIAGDVLARYARLKEIEFDSSNKKAFHKFYRSIIRSSSSFPDEKQKDFFWFALGEYGIEITREYVRKISDEEIDLISKRLDGEISEKEFVEQRDQARYPTIAAKKSRIDFDIKRELDYMDKTENDDRPVRPEIVARIKSHIEGYEDAPDLYRMARALVYEAALGKHWDDAEIEKVLAEKAKEMLQDEIGRAHV